MNKTTILTSILVILLSSAPVMAGDFYALSGVQGAVPTSLQDNVLAATEGGAACVAGGPANARAGGVFDFTGVALCASLPSISTQFANFSVFNQAPVSGAQFLQVTGF